jgi:hypothetical protein
MTREEALELVRDLGSELENLADEFKLESSSKVGGKWL